MDTDSPDGEVKDTKASLLPDGRSSRVCFTTSGAALDIRTPNV